MAVAASVLVLHCDTTFIISRVGRPGGVEFIHNRVIGRGGRVDEDVVSLELEGVRQVSNVAVADPDLAADYNQVPAWNGAAGQDCKPDGIYGVRCETQMQKCKYVRSSKVTRPACLIYVRTTSGTQPITFQSRSIIFSTLKVKCEGRRSLATSLLQSKQELLKEGKTFNKQHLTL